MSKRYVDYYTCEIKSDNQVKNINLYLVYTRTSLTQTKTLFIRL